MTALDAERNAPVDVPPVEGSRRRRKRGPSPKYSRKAQLLTYLVLAPLAILFVAPFAWLVSASFQPLSEIFQKNPSWIPQHPTLVGYQGFLNIGHIGRLRATGHGDWRWFA